MAATSEWPTSPHSATASPIPMTARLANRSRTLPGSGATNTLFSTLLPFRVPRGSRALGMKKAPRRSAAPST